MSLPFILWLETGFLAHWRELELLHLVLSYIVAFVALSVDMIVHAHTKATVVCMFAVNSVSGSVLSITYVWIGVILGVVTEIEFVIIFAALFDVCRHHTAWKDWLLDFQYLCSGFINCPDWCNTYNMDLSSCLVFAYNIPNLCFLVLSLHYCGDSGWSLHCGQVVQEEGEKRTPSRTKICQWTTITSYLHWITAAVSVSCYCWPWLHVCVCVNNRNQNCFPEYHRNVCTTLCYLLTVLLRNTSYFSWWVWS